MSNQEKISNINEVFDTLTLEEQDELILSIYQRTEKNRLQKSAELAKESASIKKSVFSLRDKLKNPKPIRRVLKKDKTVQSPELFQASQGERSVRPVEPSDIADRQSVSATIGETEGEE